MNKTLEKYIIPFIQLYLYDIVGIDRNEYFDETDTINIQKVKNIHI